MLNAGLTWRINYSLALGLSKRTFGFRKVPYRNRPKLTTLFAVDRAAYQVKYKGIFNQVLFDNDIVDECSIREPYIK